MSAQRFRCAMGALCLLSVLGCTTTKTSNTVRTGTEQLLISNAVDQVLAKVDFTPLAGKKVMVEEKYLDCTDKNYILSSIRHYVVHAGGSLTVKPEEADVVLEVRSGGVGTDTSDSYVGVPGLTLPGMITLPDVKLVTRSRQSAFAKLGIVAIDGKSKQELGTGGVSLAMSDDNNWYFMGVGPYRQGSMDKEVKQSLYAPVPGNAITLPNAVAFDQGSSGIVPRDGSETAGRIQLTGGDENAGKANSAAPANDAPAKSP